VHGIVKQSGGHIEVYSEPGRGTTFKIYLPVMPESGQRSETPSVLLEPPRGTETILMAEDEPAIRDLARIVLESCGYTVLVASDGEEAVAEGSVIQLDLLISDVVMPRMSGRELVNRLRAVHAGLKVLYISGYTDDAIVRHGIVEEGVAFLHKPFTPTILARKVREVLDATPSRFA
jgi:CheY-like chemotaxis protein